jgi:hypothetical protein
MFKRIESIYLKVCLKYHKGYAWSVFVKDLTYTEVSVWNTACPDWGFFGFSQRVGIVGVVPEWTTSATT